MMESFDVIVVGGGTAGLSLAARLSEDLSVQILVLEAGQDLTADPRVNMPAMCQSLINTSSDWGLYTTPQAHLGGRRYKIRGGRVLGGSSAINTFVFTPTSKTHIDAWAQLGNPGWDWPNFSRSMEKAYRVQDSPWGSLGEGPLDVSFAEDETQWPTVWKDTISNHGLPVSMNPLSGQIYGAYKDPETVHPDSKFRTYAGSAYLEPARSRKNLTIWTNAHVQKIIFDKTSSGKLIATGVQYIKDGATGCVEARKEVILSAGAIQSPKILELSGIGDPDILSPLGIEVLLNNPHVGENLQNHVWVGVTSEVIKKPGFETLDKLLQGDPTAIAAAQEALSKGKGPMTGVNISASAQMPLPDFSDSEAARDNLDQLFNTWSDRADLSKSTPAFAAAHESFARSILTSPVEASALYNAFPGYNVFDSNGDSLPHPGGDDRYLTFAVHLCHPLSRGSTHITSSSLSPDSKDSSPQINPNMLSHPHDLEVLARHIRQLEHIKRTEPLSSHLVLDSRKAVPDPASTDLSDLEQAKRYVLDAVQAPYHCSGSCSQMPRDLGGVVDPRLRVYGCDNLRVCDMSIAPFLPRCNPQALAYGIAEQGARIIGEDLREGRD